MRCDNGWVYCLTRGGNVGVSMITGIPRQVRFMLSEDIGRVIPTLFESLKAPCISATLRDQEIT